MKETDLNPLYVFIQPPSLQELVGDSTDIFAVGPLIIREHLGTISDVLVILCTILGHRDLASLSEVSLFLEGSLREVSHCRGITILLFGCQEKRLVGRETDTKEAIQNRLQIAKEEMEFGQYEINGNMELPDKDPAHPHNP